MKSFLLYCLVPLTLLTSQVKGQGFTPPAEGKCVIYFARVSAMGSLIPFDFFDGDTYIGQFSGKKYLRYECDPGEHLFWASSENKAFVTARVEGGKSYIVVVDVLMGIGMARVGLTPIGSDHKVFGRARDLIKKKSPVKVSPEHIRDENERLAGFIADKLQKYESRWRHELEVRDLTPEMAVTVEEFTVPPISH